VRDSSAIGSGWEGELERWLAPFLEAWRHKTRRRWAPLYLRGLIAPGERKSIEPLAERVSPKSSQQLHHFVAVSKWEVGDIEQVLFDKADALVGGADAHLIVDDTALVKKGRHSVGVAQQYCGQLGKNANCQALVSLTLARDEVPVPIVLSLYLPESWAKDHARRDAAGVPLEMSFRPKWQIALDEIRRVIKAGVHFGDVLADAGYGVCAEFRRGLSELGLTWAVGVSPDQLVYPESVVLRRPRRSVSPTGGRSKSTPSVSITSRSAKETIESESEFQTISWRRGTQGRLRADFAALRVRVADGEKVIGHRHGPGEDAWLVCERRAGNVRKYYLANHSPDVTLRELARVIKARWACEQAHQQMKEELGLDHFEGRSWNGLTHHTLLTMMAFTFLQHLRLRQNKEAARRSSAPAIAPGNSPEAGSVARRA
jgi:SRSO17 transposase